MDVQQVFHMTGGVGETSYANNSSLQKKASDMVKHITLETIQELYLTTTPKTLCLADLGCSSGQNTLSIIQSIVDKIEGTCCKTLRKPAPEFRVYLNDLPTNDFNTIFKALPDFYKGLRRGRSYGGPSVYVAGYPGTFYGRLFPDKCLHFIYSSYSLHWLSRVPPALYDEQGRSINKSNIYISESSPPQVTQAYFSQFQEDFPLFLRSRSKELISGGQMVLILLGRRGPNHVDRGNAFLWELLSRSFAILVSQGEIEQEKLDSYEVHFYAPSKDELEDEVRREGSFKVDRFEMFEIESDVEHGLSYGMTVAMTVRAIQESMICHHFGEGVLDNLFEHYGRLVDEEMAMQEIKPITFVVVLRNL
ncbi:unnamed protein product [Ilex paraguariensis]|uniref:Salicylate carboxymethyltransferase n=1 Tax=Ilex paraguariensis TaxID=185542 RepID=A0ABC8TBK6_9AQUA